MDHSIQPLYVISHGGDIIRWGTYCHTDYRNGGCDIQLVYSS
jgi:hypothetical protein